MIGYAVLAAAILQAAVIRASEAERHKKEEERFRKVTDSLFPCDQSLRKQVGEAVSSLLRRSLCALCSVFLRVAVSSSDYSSQPL